MDDTDPFEAQGEDYNYALRASSHVVQIKACLKAYHAAIGAAHPAAATRRSLAGLEANATETYSMNPQARSCLRINREGSIALTIPWTDSDLDPRTTSFEGSTSEQTIGTDTSLTVSLSGKHLGSSLLLKLRETAHGSFLDVSSTDGEPLVRDTDSHQTPIVPSVISFEMH